MVMEKVILFAVGSFNPITIMHLRMFELGREFLVKTGRYSIIGGIISPVHDSYPKKGLAEGTHRIEMTRLGALSSQWVKVSSYEALEQKDWTRTCVSLNHHQDQLDEYLHGTLSPRPPWAPDSLNRDDEENGKTPVKIKLLCGADVLETFNRPNLWTDEHMEGIVRDFGIVVITRKGDDPEASIEKNRILKAYRENIFIVQEKVGNEISSTKMREAVKAGETIRYFVPDPVIDYIRDHKLYAE